VPRTGCFVRPERECGRSGWLPDPGRSTQLTLGSRRSDLLEALEEGLKFGMISLLQIIILIFSEDFRLLDCIVKHFRKLQLLKKNFHFLFYMSKTLVSFRSSFVPNFS